jgi:hypothetical protein
MHFITRVEHEKGYRLRLWFDDGTVRVVDLSSHLDGEMFEPLKDLSRFRTARLNAEIDTVVWDNGADMSPDFLYDIGEPVSPLEERKVAESRGDYGEDTRTP